jgi:uncharacterized membrane protein
MQTISMPRARRWGVLGIVVATLASLLFVVALVAGLGAGSTVSVVASPEPVAAQAARTVHLPRGGAGPAVRGYRLPWEYGPGPAMGRSLEVSGPHRLRWLAVMVVGFLLALVAALAAALAWILLRRRSGGAAKGSVHEVIARRLADGSIDVEEFEKRRQALLGD